MGCLRGNILIMTNIYLHTYLQRLKSQSVLCFLKGKINLSFLKAQTCLLFFIKEKICWNIHYLPPNLVSSHAYTQLSKCPQFYLFYQFYPCFIFCHLFLPTLVHYHTLNSSLSFCQSRSPSINQKTISDSDSPSLLEYRMMPITGKLIRYW